MKQLKHSFFRCLLLAIAVISIPQMLLAQTMQVKGKVIDATTQKPIEGASVVVAKSTKGTSSNAQGEFTIAAEKGSKLVVSSIGYASQTIVANSAYVSVALTQAVTQVNEVVVTATGIKKEAKRLGYAVQTIDASKLTAARESDPINALKGQAAGLTINVNQEIGHSPDVIIRGENGSGDRPMFVVDGVAISSDTYNINPDDIETITVLKGPNAAALYGFQGKNGAIIISTKKGSKDKRGYAVTFNSSTQINKGFIALPKYQDTYGPGDNGLYAFGGGGSSPLNYKGTGAIGIGVNDYDYDVWGPQFRGQLIPQYDGAYDPTQTYSTTFANGYTYKGHVAPTPWVARGKDNLKRFLQAGLISTNSVSLESSTEKTDVRFSLGNTYQKGIVPNTSLNNFNVTGSIIQRFNSRLTLSSYINFSRQSTPNVPDVTYGPNSIIYNMIIWGGADWSVDDMKNYWQPGHVGTQQKYAEFYRYNNPYFQSYEWLRGHYQNNVYGYVSLNYKATKDLEFQLRPSVTTLDMLNNEKMPYSAGSYSNPNRLGNYDEDRRSRFETNVDAQVKYNKKNLLKVLDLSAIAGGTMRDLNFSYDYLQTNYLSVPGIYAFSNSLNPLSGIGYNAKLKVLSAYASVDLGYKSYLIGSVTARVDKSSTLPVNHNSYYYPSYNLASVVSDYVQLPKFVSFFKVRGSYAESKSGGTTSTFSGLSGGSLGTGYSWATPYDGPSYQFSQAYSLGQYYNGAITNSGSYTNTTIDPNVTTADRKSTEFGFDVRFLDNKLGFDVTHYHYKNVGITYQGTSAASGYSSFLTNGNTYTNDGWEITMNANPIRNKNGFNWNVTTNFSTFVKKWVNNANPDSWEYNGQRIDLVYGNAFVRTPDGKMVIDPASGLYLRYSDVGSSAKKIFGHSDPDFQWAAINTLSYKNFALRFQFDGLVGGVLEDYVRKKTLQGGRHIESAEGALGAARPSDEANIAAYTADGVNLTGAKIQLDPINGTITNMAALTQTQNTAKSQVQPFVTRYASIADLDVISKTYVKLREVTFTYTLPEKLIGGKNAFIRKATVSFVGRNLLYFFPNRYKDLDVDQYTQDSGSGLQTPTTRSYGFNVNLTF
ncbi:SusC/RagA family TonB-linked outer membrane protein [Parasediminibacterium paludis]|uniref:SusC/RagA family TonB-linked outer membrane protein n=1 Tax=Parasediminibacterium paludis TaxID=908966 RepID=A0ABV8PVU5_9BACT